MQQAVGHVEGTSLPVGGSSAHAVLSGHRGLPSAKLFTDLDEMQVGDVFYIRVLEEVHAYQVDGIETVLPDETESLAIVPGEDRVTLVTCTPYGINSHRLLVHAHAIPYTAEMESEVGRTGNFINIPLPYLMLIIGARGDCGGACNVARLVRSARCVGGRGCNGRMGLLRPVILATGHRGLRRGTVSEKGRFA